MTESILIVEDDPFAANGITNELRDHYDVQAALKVADMRLLLQKQRFDLVILDLDLKDDGSGINYINMIKETGAKVLVLTTAVDLASLMTCFRLEVNGYIRKRGESELLKKVRGALEGHLMIHPKLLSEVSNPRNEIPAFGFREAQLINLFFANPLASNGELGTMLHLSPGRVANMMQAIFKKLAIHDRHELLPALRRRGYQPTVLEPEVEE